MRNSSSVSNSNEDEKTLHESQGELEIRNYSKGKAKIKYFKVRYKIYFMMGEPCWLFELKWEPGNDKTILNSVTFRAEVYTDNLPQGAYVTFNPATPAPGQWSWDTPGSPNWDKMFKNAGGYYYPEMQAKELFYGKFKLKNLSIDTISVRYEGKEKKKSL